MTKMKSHRKFAPQRLRCGALLLGVLVALGGCTSMTYDRVQIGLTQAQCQQLLDQEIFRSCELGYSGFEQDRTGRADALVILLGRDNVVAGKLQATLAGPGSFVRGPKIAAGAAVTFQARGEVDLERLSLQGVGPLDALRAVLAELVQRQSLESAGAARELVAAGLVRLLERWPHLNTAAQFPDLADTLQRVPAGGEARIGINPQGLFCFEYVGYAAQ
jgi:hypothetical protein